MNEATNTYAEGQSPAAAPLTDEQIAAILASKPESAQVAVVEDDEVAEDAEVTVH